MPVSYAQFDREMRMKRVVGIGAGGHARVLLDALAGQPVEVIGLLDREPSLQGATVDGVPVLGDDGLLGALRSRADHAFVGVGTIASTSPRERIYGLLLAHGFTPLDVVHPAATVAPTVSWGAGVAILARVVINAGTVLGRNVIVNTGAIIEHDCVIGDHAHVATGAVIAGGVLVGARAHVGVGAVIRQGIRIGEGALVGAGAVVVKDVAPGTVVVGVPARPLRTAEDRGADT